MPKIIENKGTSTPWKQERDKIKTMWVVCVLVFWFSGALQVGLFFYEGKINFVLISIIGGMLVLGVALKIRLQRHLRTKTNK